MLASADNPLGAIPGFNHPKEDFQTVRDVSVIFPAFNEEGNIRCTVETVIRERPQVAVEWEGNVGDRGNRDAAALGSGEMEDQIPEVCETLHGRNKGNRGQ